MKEKRFKRTIDDHADEERPAELKISGKRRALDLNEGLTQTLPAGDGRLIPHVLAKTDGLSLEDWITSARRAFDQMVQAHGGVLFRGFDMTQARFKTVVQSISDELLDYSFGSTPRSLVEAQVYTSTEYPCDQEIPLHNEMSYAARWPTRIWFYCDMPSNIGGATPIADSRRVYRSLPEEIRASFEEKGVLYVRRYDGLLDLSWQDSFRTTDPAVVEAECIRQGASFEWLGKDTLVTTLVRPATLVLERSEQRVWFNQANLFHTSALPLSVQAAIQSGFKESELPRAAYFGDGSAIAPDMVEYINKTYETCAYDVKWRRGDVLMLDNQRLAHGRRPFEGERRVLVAMAS
ncbi:TauD/TfdA family dioxygenase [Roseovarius sp. M141]|uniref:TauD/TfdA family dioxygenase n=1 Tax=Roseovarius sp. M141 TaxID=2583806 RepID=UPI0020CE1F63